MSVQLLLFLDGPWEQARGYLREDLDHLMVAINTLETGGGGTGPGGLIDLSTDVTGRLPFSHLVASLSPGVLVGRRSGSAGDFEEITLGTGLTMTGTVLAATSGLNAAKVAARVALHV